MIPRAHIGVSPGSTSAIEFAQRFLLFRVDAQHGKSLFEELDLLRLDPLKLRVSFLAFIHGQVFCHLPMAQLKFVFQNAIHCFSINRVSLLFQFVRQGTSGTVGPQLSWLDGRARYVDFQILLQL